MALDTYASIAGKVLLRCPSAGILLARDWVNNAFRRIAERRAWSWLVKQDQFIFNAVYNTGTVTVTLGSNTVTGAGTAWTAAHVGRQFRLTTTTPLYTITGVDVGLQTLTLDVKWGSATAAGRPYEIYNAYASPPSDFHYFLSVWDPNFNWQLNTLATQRELNRWDAQRSNRGQAYAIIMRDYYTPAGETIPLPRFEAWPHITSAYVLPFLYLARATDISDSGAILPRYIRGDALLEMALAEAARWPGTAMAEDERGRARPINPYFNLQLANMHEAKAEFMINEMERQDEEIMINNVTYETVSQMPMAPLDANYMQKHAF